MPPIFFGQEGEDGEEVPKELEVIVVVSNMFYFHPYLGKITILTNIFQMGWNHQLVRDYGG